MLLLGQQPRGSLRLLIALSGCLGFALGLFWKATWHVNIETAQVLSGTVQYPAENAFYYYHLKLWTLLTQVPALLLKLGADERTLSLLMSGLLGAVSFVALSLCTFALCRNVTLSTLSPVFLLALFLGGAPDSPVYPIFLMGTHHTFGVMGRGIALLILALLGTGRFRAALFLLGLAPAVHPTWGAWCAGVALLSLAWGGFLTHKNLKLYGPWLSAGLVIAGCSFLYQMYVARNLPFISHDEQSQYFAAILTSFDVHRKPIPVFHPGIYLAVFSTLISLFMLRCYGKDFDRYASFFLRAMVVNGALGLLGVACTWFPDRLPGLVTLSMPGRFINLNILASSALILGLMGRYRHLFLVRTLILFHLLYVPFNWFIVPFLSDNKYGWRLEHWREIIVVGTLLVGLRIGNTIVSKGSMKPHYNWSAPHSDFRFNLGLGAALVLMLVGLSWPPLLAKPNHSLLFGPQRSDVLRAASNGRGILISAPGMELVQLRTRRPLLLNIASLDQISIFPASGALANPALKRVYGVDLLTATPTAFRKTDTLWKQRTLAEWQALRRDFGTTDILVWSDSELQLPRAVRDERFALYHIPASTEQDTAVGRLAVRSKLSIPLETPDTSRRTQRSMPKEYE